MDKVVLITGVSGGIGKSIFNTFKENGYITYGTTRNDSLVSSNIIKCELKYENDIVACINKILKFEGKIDILINNAAITTNSKFDQITSEEWDEIFCVNVRAPFLMIQNVLPTMLKNKFGRIINISSVAANSYSKSASCAYTASKYALNGMMKQLVFEYKGTGINFNCIAPSQTYTKMLRTNLTEDAIKKLENENPQHRLLYPEEIAEICLILSKSDYINGEIININGGIV